MQHRLNLILSRWELDPPAFSLEEINSLRIESIVGQDVLGPAFSSATCQCTECGEIRSVAFRRITKLHESVAYVVCPYCGTTRLSAEQIQFRSVRTHALLRRLFADATLTIQTVDSDSLWRIGRRTIGSRSRELWFVRGSHAFMRQHIEAISSRPKTILFTSTIDSAMRLRSLVPNAVLPLAECLFSSCEMLSIDWNIVGDLVPEIGEPADKPQRRVPKRASRMAKIEQLTRELKHHIRSAIDHAETASELLPRPTQEQLGRQCGLNKSDVSRCLKDSSATELRLLWKTAADLNAIQRLPRGTLR